MTMQEVLGKPLHEMTDTELRERLSFLKQQRISKQITKVSKKSSKKAAVAEDDLIAAMIKLAKQTVKESK